MNLIVDIPEFMSLTVQWYHFVDCSPRIPRQWGRDWHQPCHRGGHWENTGFLREPFTEGIVCCSTNTVVFAFHNLQTFSKVFFFPKKGKPWKIDLILIWILYKIVLGEYIWLMLPLLLFRKLLWNLTNYEISRVKSKLLP